MNPNTDPHEAAQLSPWVTHTEDAYFLHDLDGAILEGNQYACRALGYSREELLTLKLEDVSDQTATVCTPGGVEQLKYARSISLSDSYRRKNGSTWQVQVKLTLIEQGGKALVLARVQEAAGTRQDLPTARTSLDRRPGPDDDGELRRLGRVILDTVPCVALIFRPGTGEIVAQNRAAGDAGACPGGQAVGPVRRGDTPWFMDPDLWTTRETQHLESAVAGGMWDLNWVRMGPDLFAHYARDVTGHHQLEKQLAQTQKMETIGVLAGGIAHDFSNMLQVIIGATEQLVRSLEPGSEATEHCGVILKAVERGRDLTRQFLAFGRRQVLQPSVVNLNHLVEGIESMVRRLLEEDIDLQCHLDPGLGHTKADPGQIEQVLMNLVANARDALSGGGTITVRTTNAELDREDVARYPYVKPGRYVVLAVEDNGDGMDAATLEHLFEPFFTTKGAGTGLGLATAYGTVKQSGGYIWAHSESGRGSKLEVYLPRWEHRIRTEAGRTPAPASPPVKSGRILLVEDNGQVRGMVRRFLENMGHEVIEAPDADQALEASKEFEGPIHLLFTDVVMPGMSGRTLAARLTEQRPELRVLYMSGHSDETIARHGTLDSGLAFIQKPFGIDELDDKIREVLCAPASPAPTR